MLSIEQNMVVWVVKNNLAPWPAVVVKSDENEDKIGRKGNTWLVRLLGAEGKEIKAFRSELFEYVSHLFYAFQARGKSRASMASACFEANFLGRTSGPHSQRSSLQGPAFDSFANSLTGKNVDPSETSKKRSRRIDEDLAKQHCERCDKDVKLQTDKISSLKGTTRESQLKLKHVQKQVEQLKKDENRLKLLQVKLNRDISHAQTKLAEATDAVERWCVEENNALKLMQQEEETIIVQKKELERRVMNQQGSIAYLEKYGIEQPRMTEQINSNLNHIASQNQTTASHNTVPYSIEREQSNIRDLHKISTSWATAVGTVVEAAAAAAGSNAFSSRENRSNTSTPLQSQTLYIFHGNKDATYTANKRKYHDAAEELGVRMVAYDGDVEYDLSSEKQYAVKYFRKDLKAFHEQNGFDGFQIPNSQGREIDVYHLMKSVLEWGGIEAVRGASKMGHLCDRVNVARGTVGVLKRFYISYLYPYEQALALGRVPTRAEIKEMLTPKRSTANRSEVQL